MRLLLVALLLAGCTSSFQVSYSIEQDGRSDLYVINGEGHWRRRATRGPHHSRDGALSPDGLWLVYVAQEREPDSPKRLAMIDWDWHDPHFIPLPPGEPSTPSFHPAGDRLVLSFAPKGGVPAIHVCRLDGTEWRRIGDDPLPAREPVFSPDATRIAFVRGDPGAGGVWIMDSRGGAGLKRLSRPGEACSGPAFRPDGRSIAWSSKSDGASAGNLVVLDLATGAFAQRTSFADPESALSPCFSDDGGRIVFLKVERGGRPRLHVVDDRDGATPRPLAWHPGLRIDRITSSVRP